MGFLLDGLHHGDAEGDVRHEAAVHHIAVEPAGLAAVDHLDVGFQVEEVGGEKGRGYQVHGYQFAVVGGKSRENICFLSLHLQIISTFVAGFGCAKSVLLKRYACLKVGNVGGSRIFSEKA